MDVVLACQNGKPEGATELWLEPSEDGVILRGRNPSQMDFDFYLLRFTPEGKIVRYSGVAYDLGFSLDPGGYMKFVKEHEQ